MNKNAVASLDDYTVFRLLCELSQGDVSSQRELSRRLDSALGLVNGYLKNCVAQGWVKTKDLPGNRSSYQLTPAGLAEQRRLAFVHARYLDELLSVIRDEFTAIAARLHEEGVERVAFCGIDSATDLAVLAMHASGIEVSVVMDTVGVGGRYRNRDVVSLAHAMLGGAHHVVISSLKRAPELYQALLDLGADPAVLFVSPIFLEQKQ